MSYTRCYLALLMAGLICGGGHANAQVSQTYEWGIGKESPELLEAVNDSELDLDKTWVQIRQGSEWRIKDINLAIRNNSTLVVTGAPLIDVENQIKFGSSTTKVNLEIVNNGMIGLTKGGMYYETGNLTFSNFSFHNSSTGTILISQTNTLLGLRVNGKGTFINDGKIISDSGNQEFISVFGYTDVGHEKWTSRIG